MIRVAETSLAMAGARRGASCASCETGQAAAQSGSATQADAELVQRIRDAVIRELRESGALDREIDQGIERYVARQRAAAAQREENAAGCARASKVRPVSKTRDHIRGNPECDPCR